MKTYLKVIALLLHAASWPAKRIVSRITFVALPPFILEDPLIASGFEKKNAAEIIIYIIIYDMLKELSGLHRLLSIQMLYTSILMSFKDGTYFSEVEKFIPLLLD